MALADVDEGDEDGTVRHTLGARTKYPKVLARLASMPFANEDGERDSHWSLQEYIRSAVAKNENTPPETLDKLGSLRSEKDANGWIRMAVAKNLKTPHKTLQKLAKLAGDGRPKGKFRVGDSPEKIAAVAEKHMEFQKTGVGIAPSRW